ncbi:cytidylate kinase [Planifilum fulgidum]|jgi:cytidylate kinase|uniref:Cytidylate kinase n=1 Tax=Planifilum fulgidum TaxID=201973 RepID=A0A1I2L9D2_9BACL|nr:cytidylate kinase [Planifilum fulgidum]
MEMKRLTIAIDGPAGAGKSTVARRVAEEMGLLYVDTGAMYRAITWKALQSGIDLSDEQGVAGIARETEIELNPPEVRVDGIRVTEAIRSPEVTQHVSKVAKMAEVRRVLVEKQRRLARDGGVVMDGRDIGTHVLPDADVKVFLTASLEERVRRRHLEMIRRGFSSDPDRLYQEIKQRDEMDENRSHSPLRPAADAVIMDTTGRSIDEVVSMILDLCRTKVSGGE